MLCYPRRSVPVKRPSTQCQAAHTGVHLIELKAINRDTYEAAEQLSVRDDQKHLVASVTKSLADAYVYPEATFRLAYLGETIIGYTLLYPYRENDLEYVNIVRLMVDSSFQGKGYGRSLLRLALAEIRSMSPKVDVARISTLPENQIALGLYKSEGFVESGTEDGELALYLEIT